MEGRVCGLCWSGVMAVVGDHPDRNQAPVLARAAEREVLAVLSEQRNRRDAGAGARSLLDRVGPREAFMPCSPDGELGLSELPL